MSDVVIRPPDPLVTAAPTLAFSRYDSSEAVRRLLHLAYRDCTTVLDLTYGSGGFWRGPRPPGITLLTDWVNRLRGGYNQYTRGDAPYLYCALHTYRPSNTVDPKWTVQRVPRSNGATYLAYRLDSPKHRDFDKEYARQEKARRTA